MTCVDIPPAELQGVDSEQAGVAPTIPAQRRPAPHRRRWRWLAAWAFLSPGGGLAYEWLTHSDDSLAAHFLDHSSSGPTSAATSSPKGGLSGVGT